MYNLIQSQKDRTIEEITYDHNNENIKHVFASMIVRQQKNYRKKEICMKRSFYVEVFFIVASYTFFLSMFYMDFNQETFNILKTSENNLLIWLAW